MSRSSTKSLQEALKNDMNYNELLNCMRCGFCLPSCPTYTQTNQNEAASPRGRIALIKGVVDGIIEPDEDFENQLNLCLGCRACEPVCPSGVNYGHLLEDARAIINKKKKHSIPVKVFRHFIFEQLFPKRNNLQKAIGFLYFYQNSGLQSVAQKSGLLKVLPDNLTTMEKIIPKVPTPTQMKNRPTYIQAEGTLKKRVAFFSGCLMDTMFLETNNATLKLLEKAGCDVVIPQEQSCCGALHGHSGEKDRAIALAKQNIKAFEDLEVDYIILNAGGCGAFLVDYDHLLKDEPMWVERAKAFTNKVKDISEILVELKFYKRELKLREEATVTYQDSCHLRNVMKTAAAPRKLLQSINGTTYVEMEKSDSCCGSAGIYNIVQEEMSMNILNEKMGYVKEVSPTVIVTANPGCLLQMKLGIEREGLSEKIRAVHIVDLLLEAIS